MYQTLLFSVKNHIATITFNRPEVMNSFNRQMADELEEVTNQIRNSNDIRAVLLNGAGRLFMPGGDLQFFYKSLDKMPEGVMKMVRTLNASVMNLMSMQQPVLASVHGAVAGAGMSIMMACDLVIAAENTKFNMAYTGIGITPDGGATINLPRLVGTKKAMEWILFSEVFDAHTAQANGLINWVVPEKNLEDETQRILQKLANGPAQSYAYSKRLVNEGWQTSLEAQLENEASAFEACSQTQDFKQGVTSFLKKAVPEFSGK